MSQSRKSVRRESVVNNVKTLTLKEKLRRFFGFGPDLDLLGMGNMWLALMYFLTGVTTLCFHLVTLELSSGTLDIMCAENSCWTVQRETNPYSHNYNVLQNTNYYYRQTYFGIWYGPVLMLYSILTGFRFTRLVVNFGYLLHITMLAFCIVCFPLVFLDVLSWMLRHKLYIGLVEECHILQVRACNDFFLLVITAGMAIIQLIINQPYLQVRSIRLIGPLLTALATHKKANRHWLQDQPFYHNIHL